MTPSAAQPPPRVYKAHDIVPIMESGIGKIQAARDEILQTVTPATATFDNVIRPRAHLWNTVNAETGIIWTLGYASPDKAVHAEVDKARQLMKEAKVKWMSEDSFFQLIRAVADRGETLDREDSLYLKDQVLGYTRCGYGKLTGPQIDAFLEARREIDTFRDRFRANLRTESGGLWFTKEELDGVPSDFLEGCKDGEEHPNEGKKFLTFSDGGFKAVITYAHDSETRKRMYVGDQRKLPENIGLFREVITRRDSQTRLLGYPNHGAFRIERRAAKSVDWVHNFLKKLQDGLVPLGRKELKGLKERWKEHLENKGEQVLGDGFPPWDLKYYQRLAEQDVQVDRAKLAEFFPLQYTAPAMLDIFASAFRLRFTPIPLEELDESVIWHESVQVWSVWDERN